MELDFATAWEAISDEIPDEDALICGDVRRSWRDYETRAARLGAALVDAGLPAAANVGLALYNGPEYSEAQFACFKQRITPFNVNYRYTAKELRSLLDGADCQALLFDASLAEAVDEARRDLPGIRLFVQVGQGEGDTPDWATDYEALLAAHDPAPRIERSPDDLWMLFTGGTTGNPKGVMWPHGNMIQTMRATYAGLKERVPTNVEELIASVRRIREAGRVTRQLAAAPLMHGTSGISGLTTHTTGGAILTLEERSFSGDALFQAVERHGATHLTIVGDAFSRPMLEALEGAKERGEPYDLSSIFLILSSGVMWSAPIKQALLEFNPRMRLMDSLGSSEGVGFAAKLESDPKKATTARFQLGEHTKVIDEEGREVEPGSGVRGRLALGGPLPTGYYKDPKKSEETWPTIGGPPLLDSRRLGDRRGGRLDHPARARLGLHQLGRREDLSRGGRGSPQAAPGREGLLGRRGAGRAMGTGDHRRRPDDERRRGSRARRLGEGRARRLQGPEAHRRPWDQLDNLLTIADVVISSTGSREPVLTRKMLRKVVKKRRYESLVIIDIAVPRDVEAAAGNLDGIYLFDIDDLQRVVASNLEERAREAEVAGRIVDHEVQSFASWLRSQRVVPTIRALREHFTAVADAEVERTVSAVLREDDPDKRERAVRRLGKLIVNKLLHAPMTALKAGDEFDVDALVAATHRLFPLQLDGGEKRRQAADRGETRAPVDAPLAHQSKK